MWKPFIICLKQVYVHTIRSLWYWCKLIQQSMVFLDNGPKRCKWLSFFCSYWMLSTSWYRACEAGRTPWRGYSCCTANSENTKFSPVTSGSCFASQSSPFPCVLSRDQRFKSHSCAQGAWAWKMSFLICWADLLANLPKRKLDSLSFFFFFWRLKVSPWWKVCVHLNLQAFICYG